MVAEVLQGDVLKVEKIKDPVLVLSKDFFNTSGAVIACPIFSGSVNSPLHIAISTKEVQGVAQCEKLAMLDLSVRGYKKLGKITLRDRMEITDVVQGIFDYI